MDDRQAQHAIDRQYLLNYVKALKKPLLFVAGNEFANLPTVRDLDKTLLTVIERALALAFRPRHKELLREIHLHFVGYGSLETDAKRGVISGTLSRLRSLERELLEEGESDSGDMKLAVQSLRADVGIAERQADRSPGMQARTGLRDAGRSFQSRSGRGNESDRGSTGREPEARSPRSVLGLEQSGGRETIALVSGPAEPAGPDTLAVAGDLPRREEERSTQVDAAGPSETRNSGTRGGRDLGRDRRTPRERETRGRDRELRSTRPPGREKDRQNGTADNELLPVRNRVRVPAPYKERSDQDLNWGRARKVRPASLQNIPLLHVPPGSESGAESSESTLHTESGDVAPLREQLSTESHEARGRTVSEAGERNATPPRLPGPEQGGYLDERPLRYSDAALGVDLQEDTSDTTASSVSGTLSLETVLPHETSHGEVVEDERLTDGPSAMPTGPETSSERVRDEFEAAAQPRLGDLADRRPVNGLSTYVNGDNIGYASDPSSSSLNRRSGNAGVAEIGPEKRAVAATVLDTDELDLVADELRHAAREGEIAELAEESLGPNEQVSAAGGAEGESTRDVNDMTHSGMNNASTADVIQSRGENDLEGIPSDSGTLADSTAQVQNESLPDIHPEQNEDALQRVAHLADADDNLTIDEFMAELIDNSGSVEPVTTPLENATDIRSGRTEVDENEFDEAEDEEVSTTTGEDETRRRGRRRRRRRKGLTRESAAGIPATLPESPAKRDASQVASLIALFGTPIAELKGVGPKLGAILEQQGIRTLLDVLRYLPRSYQDRRRLCAIADLRAGQSGMFVGKVESSDLVSEVRSRSLTVCFSDGSGSIEANWPNLRSNYLKNRFRVGASMLVWGQIEDNQGKLVVSNPETEPLGGGEEEDGLSAERISPNYAPIEGIGQKTLRRIMHQALTSVRGRIPDPVPAAVRSRQRLMDLEAALWDVHFPPLDASLDQLNTFDTAAHRTLAFHDLFLLQLALAYRRKALANEPGTPVKVLHRKIARLLHSMPPLTLNQQVALEDIKRDLNAPHPMLRILQADVLGGYFEVAALAIAMVLECEYQVAVIAPTEALVEQHAYTLRKLLGRLGVEVETLTGSVRGRVREKLIHRLRKGDVQLIVGTHALFHEGISFKRLGLAIIDEQYRVGLVQRKNLLRRGVNPDILVLASAPIPRGLLLTVYGDLTWSELRDPVAELLPVSTRVVLSENREEIERDIRSELSRGQQLFYVAPSAPESDTGTSQRVIDIATRLREEVFPGVTVGHIHSRSGPQEQEATLQRFRSRELQILVCSSELEVRRATSPRASLMIVERADELSLIQLHCMRCSVVNRYLPTSCFLVPGPSAQPADIERLQVLEQTVDGMQLAEYDFRVRGAADYLGVRQAGLTNLGAADLTRHGELLEAARREAFRWADDSPESSDELAAQVLTRCVRQRWPSIVEGISLS